MSADAVYVLLGDGEAPRFGYDRWGALRWQRELCLGPAANIERLRLRCTDPGFTSLPWTCSAQVVNVAERSLLFWGRPDFNGVQLQLYLGLIGRLWPGWRTRFASAGAQDILAAFPRTCLKEAVTPPAPGEPVSLEEIRRTVDAVWTSYAEEMAGCLADLQQDHGVDAVRALAEEQHPRALVTLGRGGDRKDLVYPDVANDHVLALGPALIADAEERAAVGSLRVRAREDMISQTVFFDFETRTVWWWWRNPAWVMSWPAWTGWTLRQHEGGVRHHMTLTGRAVAEVVCPGAEALGYAEQVQAILSQDPHEPVALLSAAAKALPRESSDRVTITAPGSLPPPQNAPSALSRILHELAHEMFDRSPAR